MWALGLYVVVALATIGRGVLVHPGRDCACLSAGSDPEIFMWSLAWWPHALLHGINPFFSHAIWAPSGANVAAATTIPAAAIALWPVTALFGPVMSYNVLAILSPALSGLTAYLLCRRLRAGTGPALVGGYLFGFSSYQLGELLGHLHLTPVFLLPVMVHLAVRRLEDDLSGRRFAALLAIVFVGQALLSTEVLFDVAVIGLLALLLGYITVEPQLRPRIERLSAEVIVAGFAAVVVLSPYLVAALSASEPHRSGDAYGLNLANLVLPTPITWLGGDLLASVSRTFDAGNVVEAGGYLSVPVLLGFALFTATTWRRRRLTRFLAVMVIATLVLAFGSPLHVAGHDLIPLPWGSLQLLPGFRSVVPSRLVVFAVLGIAVGMALWLSDAGRRPGLRWAIACLGIAALLPNLAGGWWGGTPDNPAFFRTDAYHRQHLRRGENVLTIPLGGNSTSLLWQAETNFYFTMTSGYVSDNLPNAAARSQAITDLLAASQPSAQLPLSDIPLIRRFLAADHIHHIIVDPSYRQAWSPVLRRLARPDGTVGGTSLYSVT
jgi:hypothetical protein